MRQLQRSDRVAEEIKKIVAQLLREEIRDPNLPLMTTVTSVEVSRDLAYATVFVSSLGGSAESEQVLSVLEHSKGFIRREVSHRIRLRQAPEFRFKYDNSSEIGANMAKLINDVLAKDKQQQQNSVEQEVVEE